MIRGLTQYCFGWNFKLFFVNDHFWYFEIDLDSDLKELPSQLQKIIYEIYMIFRTISANDSKFDYG